MRVVMGGRGRSGGMRLGSLLLFVLLGIAALAALNAKDVERYFKLRNM